MNRPPFMSWLVYKEVRALFWPWFAFALAIAAVPFADERFMAGGSSLVLYVTAAVVLGGMSIGQEFAQGTLVMWLAQPARRSRLLFTKLAVLAGMLMVLAALVFIVYGPHLHVSTWDRNAYFLLPAACGVFIAPWMTLVGRSAAAGVVFTVAIPALVALGATVGRTTFHPFLFAGRHFEWTVFVYGMLILCGVGAVQVWRKMRRLEGLGRRDSDFYMPMWRHRAEAGKAPQTSARMRRHPVRSLLTKELRLYSLAFALTGLYLVVWCANAFWGQAFLTPLIPVTFGPLIAIALGACGIAEERRWGTTEWQQMLPMATWTQQAVKLGVLIGLTVLLALALPIVVDDLWAPLGTFLTLAAIVLPVAAVSFYASSVCSGGMSAVVISVAATALAIGLFSEGAMTLGRIAAELGRERFHWFGWTLSNSGRTSVEVVVAELRLFGLGLVVLATVLALRNQRHADLSPGRIVRQVGAISLYLAAGMVILGVTMSGVWLSR